MKQGIAINQSLTNLGQVIQTLADNSVLSLRKQKRVPYRNSKLTLLLRNSLGGNSKTIMIAALAPSGRRSLCEWKGEAVDFDLVDGPGSVAWCYPRVFPEFAGIAGWFAFYPSRLECFVADERARPQPGGYYGGWLTEEIVGPVKGEPGITG